MPSSFRSKFKIFFVQFANKFCLLVVTGNPSREANFKQFREELLHICFCYYVTKVVIYYCTFLNNL